MKNTTIDFILYLCIFISIAVLIGLFEKVWPHIRKAIDKRGYRRDIDEFLYSYEREGYKDCYQYNQYESIQNRIENEIRKRELKTSTPKIRAQISILEDKYMEIEEKKQNLKSKIVEDFKECFYSKKRVIENKTDAQIFEDIITVR